jgi:phosphomannomutase
MALALRHLVEVKQQRGDVVKTVSTTMMIDNIARQYGLTVHETPVGFNHIGDLMMHRDVLIGGEESGGISIKGHIPEGDGILMGLLLLEIIAYHRAPLQDIIADLQSTFGPAHYGRIDVKLNVQRPKKQVVKVISEHAPQTLIGEAVARVDTMDGVKFYLNDNSWLLIRPSGTEPVLRIYAEARSTEAVKGLLEAGSAMGSQVL